MVEILPGPTRTPEKLLSELQKLRGKAGFMRGVFAQHSFVLSGWGGFETMGAADVDEVSRQFHAESSSKSQL